MLLNTLIYIAFVLSAILMIRDGITGIKQGQYIYKKRVRAGLFNAKLKLYRAKGRAAFYFSLSDIVTGGILYVWLLLAIITQSSLVFGNIVVCMFIMTFFGAIIQSIAVNRNTITPLYDDK